MRLQHTQRGLSLITVIFGLLILASLGAALVKLLTANTIAVATEVLSARAFMTAESAAQRMLGDIAQNGQGACINNPGYNFPALPQCQLLAMQCSATTVASSVFYTISATGRCGPASEASSRTVDVQARDL